MHYRTRKRSDYQSAVPLSLRRCEQGNVPKSILWMLFTSKWGGTGGWEREKNREKEVGGARREENDRETSLW